MNEEQKKQVGSVLEGLKQTLTNMSSQVATMSASQKAAASSTLSGISNTLSGISGRVSGSTPAVTATSESAQTTTQDAYDAILKQNQDFQRQIERQYEMEARLLDDQYRARSSDIRADAESAQRDTERRQETDTARLSRDLASVGGYLGGSISGTSTMLGLSADQRTELFRLSQERDRLMRDAELDYRAGRTQMLRDKMDSLMQIQSREAELRLAQEDKRYTRAQDRLQMIQGADPSKMDANTLATLSRDLGMTPEAVSDYLFVAYASSQAKSAKEQLEYNKSLIGLLQSLPYGEEIELPDGTVYVGLGDTDDYYYTSATDNNGNHTVIGIDKRTGQQVSRVTTPGVGRTYSTGSGGGASSIPSNYFPQYSTARRQQFLDLGLDPSDTQSARVLDAGGDNFIDWLFADQLTPDYEVGGYTGQVDAMRLIDSVGPSGFQQIRRAGGTSANSYDLPTTYFSAEDYRLLYSEWKPLYGIQTHAEKKAKSDDGPSNEEFSKIKGK